MTARDTAGTAEASDSSWKKAVWAGALLIIYAVVGTWGRFDFSNMMGYYDLLAEAFLKAQLHIDIRPGDMYVHDMIPFDQDFHFGPGTVTVYTRAAPNTTSFRAEPCTSPPAAGPKARPSAHRR